MARTKRLIGAAAFGLWLSWVADSPAGAAEALRLAWAFALLAAAFVEAHGLGAAVVVGLPAAALTLAARRGSRPGDGPGEGGGPPDAPPVRSARGRKRWRRLGDALCLCRAGGLPPGALEDPGPRPALREGRL